MPGILRGFHTKTVFLRGLTRDTNSGIYSKWLDVTRNRYGAYTMCQLWLHWLVCTF